MAQIIVTMHVLCDSEATAQKVLSEYMPSPDGMAGLPGILGVKSEWVADRSQAEQFYGGPMPDQVR
jgi:hypothetical protein